MTEIKEKKTTVRLPKTNFSMKANFSTIQQEVLKYWDSENIYSKVQQKNASGPSFVLHDGPPYANGNIHLGHALNKILKDILVKGHNILGFNSPFVLGWDTHGLPIEWKIEEKYKEKGIKKSDVPLAELRKECSDFADFWIDNQVKEFKELGVLADYLNNYTTKQPENEAVIVKSIFKLLKDGVLYRDKKPITWSYVEQTALAEAEVEYKDIKTLSVYVGFKVVDCENPLWRDSFLVIYTTTAWTLPANQALAYGENINYGLYKVKAVEEGALINLNTNFVVASDLLNDFCKTAKITEVELLDQQLGLKNFQVYHPLFGINKPTDSDIHHYNYSVPTLAGDFVDVKTGTGIVHMAPAHGEDDFYLCKKHGIKPIELVQDNGSYSQNTDLFAGQFIAKITPQVVEKLTLNNTLFATQLINHSYPHSWRSKAPVITRLTTQWFISLSNTNARENALLELENVEMFPKVSKNRLKSMLENRPDWTISRQRAWGVPIALFVNKKTKEPLINDLIFNDIEENFAKFGAGFWFESDNNGIKNTTKILQKHGLNEEDFEVVNDILDVWLESGLTQAFVLKTAKYNLSFPADVYLEGSDQHRGWFQSSLIMSVLLNKIAPFKKIITHGFVLDEKSQKMSKSLGNGITPAEIIKNYGTDVMRLWVANSNYSEDITVGKNILNQQSEIYRKIRNTLKYLLGNLAYYNQEVNYSELDVVDKYILHLVYELDIEYKNAITENFSFHFFMQKLFNFISLELSSFYFDTKKDILYCDSSNSINFKSSLFVMDILFKFLSKWLYAFIPFTIEEAMAERYGKPLGSAILNNFEPANEQWKNKQAYENVIELKKIKSVVNACLEKERANKTIGSSLEASPTIFLQDKYLELVKDIKLADFCITSSININNINNSNNLENLFTLKEISGVFVDFAKASGEKCERCWKYYNVLENCLCSRCKNAVLEMDA